MRQWVLGHRPTFMTSYQVHWPLIVSEPLKEVWKSQSNPIASAWDQASIVIWTSREAVRLWEMWRAHMREEQPRLRWHRHGLTHYCVGKGTSQLVELAGGKQVQVARIATAEGLLDELIRQPLQHAKIVWLHAVGARPILRDRLSHQVESWTDLAFYETRPRWEQVPPPYDRKDQLLFTSPSCVHAWERLQWPWPSLEQVRAIGPITAAALETKLGSLPEIAQEH